jgi:hypothetical protein
MDCLDPTATDTPTATVTQTAISTPTFTYTATLQAQNTATVTATSTATPDTQAIKNLLPYPNPVYASASEIYFGFTLNQKDCDTIGLRIYTVSARLIREVDYSGAAKDTILANGRLRYTTDNFRGLANGTYYYFIYAVKNKVETRSAIDKIVILK